MPQAPTSYDPFYRSRVALARRNEVLRAMLDNHDINPGAYDWAVSQGLRLKPGQLYTRIREPYFFSYVRDQLIDRYGANTVRSGGLKVYTTIVPRYQAAAVKAIRDTLYYRTDPASALVAIDPATGAIKAMTGVIPGKAQERVQPGRSGPAAGRLDLQDIRAHDRRVAGNRSLIGLVRLGAVPL